MRRTLIGQNGGSAFTAFADWRRVEDGLVALAMDIRRATKITKEQEPGLAPLFEHTANLVFGVDLHDSLKMCAFAQCADNKAAETLVHWAKSQIAEEIAPLDKKKGDKAASMSLGDRWSHALLKHARVEQHDSQATLRTHMAIDFTELRKLLMAPK